MLNSHIIFPQYTVKSRGTGLSKKIHECMNNLNQYCAAYLRGFVNISANISQGFVPWEHVEPSQNVWAKS